EPITRMRPAEDLAGRKARRRQRTALPVETPEGNHPSNHPRMRGTKLSALHLPLTSQVHRIDLRTTHLRVAGTNDRVASAHREIEPENVRVASRMVAMARNSSCHSITAG